MAIREQPEAVAMRTLSHGTLSLIQLEDIQMEDLNAWVQIISTVGFPICCTAALFYYMEKERQSHKEEVDGLKEVINANTVMLAEIKTLLEKKESGN